MNRWKHNILDNARESIRFGLNLFVVVGLVMLGVFGVLVLYELLTHLYGYLSRTWFSGRWGL